MSQLNVDSIKNRTGTGAPSFPSGASVTGVITATTFSGNITGVAATFTGNVSIAGTLTYEDVTNIDSVGLVTARSGVNIVGGGLTVTGVTTFNSLVNVGSGLTITGITTFNNDIRLRGVVERVAAATTYLDSSNRVVLELDVRAGTTYRYSMPNSTNIGIVSFKNLPADTENGSTVTVLFTQNSTTPTGGIGNTQPASGIGTNCTVVPFVGGAAITGISTRALVGSATTIVLSGTASDVDFVSFFVHYNGGSTSAADSYKVYATKNGGFQRGNVGV